MITVVASPGPRYSAVTKAERKTDSFTLTCQEKAVETIHHRNRWGKKGRTVASAA